MKSIVESIVEQNKQMSLRISEQERAVHFERESLREEINRNRQENSRSKKRLKERTDECLAENLSRITREAEQRETRLRDDMEKLKSQHEQTFGTLDSRKDAMTERRTHAVMDRLDGLLGDRSGSRNRGANSGVSNREARVNFNEHSIRERHMEPREEGAVHPAMPPGTIGRCPSEYRRRFYWQQTNLRRTADARRKYFGNKDTKP